MMTCKAAVAGKLIPSARRGRSIFKGLRNPFHPRREARARGEIWPRYFAGMLLALCVAGPAFAQDAAITLKLTPVEVAAVLRSMDRQPITKRPPAGFWGVQVKISDAITARPDLLPALRAANREAAR